MKGNDIRFLKELKNLEFPNIKERYGLNRYFEDITIAELVNVLKKSRFEIPYFTKLGTSYFISEKEDKDKLDGFFITKIKMETV